MNNLQPNKSNLKPSAENKIRGDSNAEKQKRLSYPMMQLSRGRFSKIIIKLTLGLMSLLFGINPRVTKRFIYWQQSLRDKSGVVYYIRYMKQARLHITRYICGNPLKSNTVGVSLDKDGFPARLAFLKELVEGKDPIKTRGVLTLMYLTRAIVPTEKEDKKILPNFSPITDRHKGDKEFKIPLEFIEEFVAKYKLKSKSPEWSVADHYISGKSSPTGKATKTGGLALWIMSSLNSPVLTYFSDLLGIEKYMQLILPNLTKIWRSPKLVVGSGKLCSKGWGTGFIGKLSLVNDPELKLRVIAMVDYYSQFLLRPIHDNLMNLLRHFPCDRTFSQDPRHEWRPKGNKFWSLDLSSATDRFPVSIQEDLLSCIYNKDLARTWKSILLDRDYLYDEEGDLGGGLYRYSVGQPMGAYSSWAAFTLSHHLVVHYAAHLCGIEDFKAYILLGDDIVINNDKVARKYISLMTKLGVEISEQKTHVSYNTYEFAKRWFKSKIEISPLPIKGILQNFDNKPVVLLQLMNYVKRCNTLWTGNSLELISKLYDKLVINKRYNSYRNTYNRLEVWFNIYRYSFGTLPNWEIRRFLIKQKVQWFFVDVRDELIPAVMRELLHFGLIRMADRAAHGIKDMFDEYCSYCESQLRNPHESVENDIPCDARDFNEMPLFHALRNRLDQVGDRLNKILDDREFNLIDAMNSMRIESVDKIVSEKRDLVQMVSGLNSLWKGSITSVRKVTEENYTEMRSWENLVSMFEYKGSLQSPLRDDNYSVKALESTISGIKDQFVYLNKGYLFEKY
jgi:hypothetical protein